MDTGSLTQLHFTSKSSGPAPPFKRKCRSLHPS